MTAFTFKLERVDGTPADPATFHIVVPNWRIGDTIPLGRERALRVIGTRHAHGSDEGPVLVVEFV